MVFTARWRQDEETTPVAKVLIFLFPWFIHKQSALVPNVSFAWENYPVKKKKKWQ